MPAIKVNIEPKMRSYADWMAKVPERIQLEIDQKGKTVKRKTKKEVQDHLTDSFGVDEGIYKRSFIINDYSRSKWELCFQVFARKPHYRLTHLIEGNGSYGHKTILFRWGKGRPTKVKGLIGMSQVFQTRDHYKDHEHEPGFTGFKEHIEPGQRYAEEQLPLLYDEGINKVLKEGMRRIK